MTITRITMLAGETCGIWVDGVRRVTTDAMVVYEEGLRPGLEVDEAYIAALAVKGDVNAAKNKAMELLGYRDYCEAELAERLGRTYDPRVAAVAARRMAELGLVDDRSYAERLARDLLDRRGLSLRHAREEMKLRSVSRELTDEVLEGREDGEAARAEAVLRKKYAKKLALPDGRSKVTAALARMGFRFADIRAAIEAYNDGADEPLYEE